jgi:hypothetical protein
MGMQAFFNGRLMGVVLVIGTVAAYKGYKAVDHALFFTEVDAKILSAKSVCTAKLKDGGESEFPCSEYDAFDAAGKRVSIKRTAWIQYISPVDKATHLIELPVLGYQKTGQDIKLFASDSDPAIAEIG